MPNETPPACHALERSAYFILRMVAAKYPNSLEGQFAQRVIDVCKRAVAEANALPPGHTLHVALEEEGHGSNQPD